MRNIITGAIAIALLIFILPSHARISVNELNERVEILEGNMELAEETVGEIRDELENQMKISGYTDVEYILTDGEDPYFRMHHLSLFFQKKISQRWRFFSEIEYEDAPKFESDGSSDSTTGVEVQDWKDANGKLFVEAVNVDYRWKPEATFRFGRFFTPAGIWSIDHYPPFVYTQERPKHIRKIFPQLVDGVMVYGTLKAGSTFINYDAYYGNGEGNTGKTDKNADKAVGFKASALFNLPRVSHFELGGTIYFDPKDTKHSDNEKLAVGGHAKLKLGSLAFQTEAAFSQYDASSDAISVGTAVGYYAQIAYEPNQWAYGYRYDFFDSDRDVNTDLTTHSIFLNYRVLTNLVAKVEHHFISQEGDDDSTKTIFSVVTYLE